LIFLSFEDGVLTIQWFPGLKHRSADDDRRMGLYSGKEFVYEESNWSLISFWRLFKRYGFNVFKIKGYIEEMLKSFDQ